MQRRQTDACSNDGFCVPSISCFGEKRLTIDVNSFTTEVSGEVEAIRTSAEINEQAIEAAVQTVEAGMTERELAAVYNKEVCERGAVPHFNVIAFGSHSAYPSASPGDRTLEVGDLIRFDIGCKHDNYSSDLARTYAFKETTDLLRSRYDVLNRAMEHEIAQLKDGISTKEVFS